MRKITLSLVFIGLMATSSVFAQKSWKQAKISTENSRVANELQIPSTAQIYSVNLNSLKNELSGAPMRGQFAGNSNSIISIPNSSGEMMKYRIEEASVFAPELQERYPEIRAYAGYGIDDPTAYLRFTVSPYNGVNGIVLTGDRSESNIIQDLRDGGKVAIFKRSDRKVGKEFTCSTPDEITDNFEEITDDSLERAADDATLREFDLAMSVSAEYSAFHGGTLASVNAAIATTIARQNSVYEIDFAVTFVLVAGNDSVIFFTPGTPYSSTSDASYNSDLQTTLDANIGSANYDVGHLMAGIGNNGNAGCIGCVCVNGQKGSGFTTSTNPIGDTFDIDYVAHELGHQFGGRHTFTHASEGGGIAQMEPGSGSTIMGYAGITGATDVQSNSDPYFHAISIQQITTHAKSRGCDVETPTGNTNPVITPGADLTLPIGTAFRLTGSATDANGDSLSYCWEQYDEEDAANAYPDPTAANNNRPLFRSRNPNSTGIRTFPLMSDLVATGVNGTTWEKIPTVARSADFRLTVRDNRAGGAANVFDDIVVTWDASRGPLEVTSQATPGLIWDGGSTQTINWNVNSTNLMAGASNVDILLSTDGGVTFPTTLASNIANDGSEMITVPETPAPYCRVMVQPTGAPFFAINTVDFAIDYQVTTSCSQHASGTLNTAIPDGTGPNAQGPAIFDTITVTGETGNVVGSEMNINVDLDHTWLGDLVIQVTAPDGTTFLTLWNRDCNSGEDDMDVIFNDSGSAIVCANPTVGTYTPAQALAGFDGQAKNGDWVIAMADFYNGDTGTLTDWYVEFCETTETLLSIEDNELEGFSIHPVPNKGIFTVDLTSNSGNDVTVMVHDIRGRRIFSNSYTNTGSFSEEIRLSNVQSGIYLVTVSDGERNGVKKILID